MARTSRADNDYNPPASAATLDGYKRVALAVVLQAIKDCHEPDLVTATDALCFLLDDSTLGLTAWLDACGDLGEDPVRVFRRVINGKNKIKRAIDVE